MRLLLTALPILAACTQTPDVADVVGPFTGTTTRFVVDSFEMPSNTSRAGDLGGDLNGDGSVDNQLGMVIGTLATQMDTTSAGPSMIASGVISSFVEIQADDRTTDNAVGVTYFGVEGAAATVVGGRFAGGRFTSNLTRESHASAEAELHLPVFASADPTIVRARAIEIFLTPDGHGGYDGQLHGVVDPKAAFDAAAASIIQQLTARPRDHAQFASIVDANLDGKITVAEVEHNELLVALLAPDLKMFDGDTLDPQLSAATADSLSLGFAFHLSPCPTGSCAPATPPSRCDDRVLDGDETDIDCGGSCGTCGAGMACSAATDCDSGACDAGHCRAPSCSDGVRDGFESDVDCGFECGARCGLGAHCNDPGDCISQVCDNNRCGA